MFYNSLFFQIILAGIALALVIVYIEPTFKHIGDLQNEIDKHQRERSKVEEVNKKLAFLAKKVIDIPESEQRALLIYMPDKIDSVAVSRDIFNLAKNAGLTVDGIKYEDKKKGADSKIQTATTSSKHLTPPVPHKFTVNLVGKYEQIKSFLASLEESNYPLEINNLDVTTQNDSNNKGTTANSDELNVNVDVITYSHI